MDITKERIEKILAAGANVIFTTKGIDDLCMKVVNCLNKGNLYHIGGGD